MKSKTTVPTTAAIRANSFAQTIRLNVVHDFKSRGKRVTHLKEALGCKTKHADKLWAGEKYFTVGELDAVAHYLDAPLDSFLAAELRCDIYDWCIGHYLEDIQVEADQIFHIAESEVLHEFTKLNARSEPQQAEVSRQIEKGVDALHVQVNIEAPFTRLELRTLAEELVSLADKLLERGAAMEVN